MIKLITLTLIFSVQLWAQDDFSKDREKILLDRQKNLDWEKQTLKNRAEYKSIVEAKSQELKFIESTMSNRPELIADALKTINEQLESRPSLKRKRFFKCIRSSLETRGLALVDNCTVDGTKNFTPEDLGLIKTWKQTIAMSPQQLTIKKESVSRELKLNEERYKNTDKNLEYIATAKISNSNAEELLNSRIKDKKLISENAKFINCDAGTPEISLEEEKPFPGATFKGPFFGVPRDNQDGLGTCYANTAKNLLVSTSSGEDVASFLDLALIYKGDNVSNDGLDAGGSCATLERMQAKGYCPQEYAPAEQGDKNHLAQGLLGGSKRSIYEQSTLVNLLQEFFQSQEVLTKNNKKFADQALSQANLIIHNLKSRPNVKIPFPVARFPIPNKWKLKEAMSTNGTKAGFKADDFLKDYKEAYNKFYPEYIKGIMTGKSRDDIFASFLTEMKGFIDKYSLGSSMDTWKRMFIADTERDWTDPNLKNEIAQSVELMKAMSGKADISDDEFVKSCDKTVENFEFLTTLQPLMKHLESVGADAELLYDENGKFKSHIDLMQLAIAPGCLNPKNRKMPKSGIICETGYGTVNDIKNSGKPVEAQKRMLREKIAVSLLQGYALGNSFERHINTIVGMRFNAQSNRCEFKIRESQNGTSTWQDEQRIFTKIEALAEVRRK